MDVQLNQSVFQDVLEAFNHLSPPSIVPRECHISTAGVVIVPAAIVQLLLLQLHFVT